MTRSSIYQCDGLRFTYGSGKLREEVLSDVSVQVHQSDFVCLAGPSGSGKSTLLNLLGLLVRPEKGNLLYRGQPLANASDADLSKIRRQEIGFIFQDFQLIDVLSVYENVEYFLARMGIARRERSARVRAALALVQLHDYAERRPTELSGGQKQRVAIARAIAKQPQVIIADEPTASLDSVTSVEVLELLHSLNLELGTTIVMASHDPLAIDFAGRVIRLDGGRIVENKKGGIAC